MALVRKISPTVSVSDGGGYGYAYGFEELSQVAIGWIDRRVETAVADEVIGASPVLSDNQQFGIEVPLPSGPRAEVV